jgi:hypothetical protein
VAVTLNHGFDVPGPDRQRGFEYHCLHGDRSADTTVSTTPYAQRATPDVRSLHPVGWTVSAALLVLGARWDGKAQSRSPDGLPIPRRVLDRAVVGAANPLRLTPDLNSSPRSGADFTGRT